MRGDPDPSRELDHAFQGGPEGRETRAGVAVIGPKAREVDIADEGNSAGLDQQHAMAGSMTGHVDRLDAHPAQIPTRAVVVGGRVGALPIAKLVDHFLPQRLQRGGLVTIMGCEPFPAARGCDIGLVHEEGTIGKPADTHHVILVDMPQDHQIGVGQLRVDLERDEGQVKDRRRIAAVDP